MKEKQILVRYCLHERREQIGIASGVRFLIPSLCEYSLIGKAPDFQSGDIGSIPIIRSNPEGAQLVSALA